MDSNMRTKSFGNLPLWNSIGLVIVAIALGVGLGVGLTLRIHNLEQSTRAAQAILAEEIENATLPTYNFTAGTYGDDTSYPIITVEENGVISAVTTQAIQAGGVTNAVFRSDLANVALEVVSGANAVNWDVVTLNGLPLTFSAGVVTFTETHQYALELFISTTAAAGSIYFTNEAFTATFNQLETPDGFTPAYSRFYRTFAAGETVMVTVNTGNVRGNGSGLNPYSALRIRVADGE